MTCIEEDDAEGLAAISEDPDAVRQVFPDIQAYWPAQSDDTYICKEFTDRIGVQSGEKYKIVTAVYSVQSSDGEYQVTLEARLEGDEPLIHIFHVVSAEDLAGTE
ncbi:MAG: hypothetical protein IJM69_04325 [Firmicutes bacterium]|nr:hypothetical protein [Bacillota bacterium]